MVYTEILTECTPVEWISRFTDPGGNVLCTCICCAVSQFDFQRFTQASAHSACTPYRQEVTKPVITKKVKEHKLLSTRTKKCLMEVCILSCATTLCYFLWLDSPFLSTRLSFSFQFFLPSSSVFFYLFLCVSCGSPCTKAKLSRHFLFVSFLYFFATTPSPRQLVSTNTPFNLWLQNKERQIMGTLHNLLPTWTKH